MYAIFLQVLYSSSATRSPFASTRVPFQAEGVATAFASARALPRTPSRRAAAGASSMPPAPRSSHQTTLHHTGPASTASSPPSSLTRKSANFISGWGQGWDFLCFLLLSSSLYSFSSFTHVFMNMHAYVYKVTHIHPTKDHTYAFIKYYFPVTSAVITGNLLIKVYSILFYPPKLSDKNY